MVNKNLNKMINKNDLKIATPEVKTKPLKMHVSLPCPLKVPFKQMFTPILENYNAAHPESPIQCSNITDCSLNDIEEDFRTAKDESTLPDILITTNYRILLANGFYDRFIANHAYEGVVNPKYTDKIPAIVKKKLLDSNIGVWIFSSWSFVQDLTVEQPTKPIDSWAQIVSSEMEGKITVHGHVDKATFSIAYFMKEKYGEEALKQYARNVADIKHFAQAIKRMNSDDPNKTLLTMLPDVAISNIPSNKKIKVLNLKEAKVLSPMVMMVKRSKMNVCKEILDALWSEPFEKLLIIESGSLLPHQLEADKEYFIPDFGEISRSFEAIEAEIDKIYVDNLPLEKIESKITEGGVCK